MAIPQDDLHAARGALLLLYIIVAIFIVSGCAPPPPAPPLDTLSDSFAGLDSTLTSATTAAAPRCLRKSPRQRLERTGLASSSGPLALARWDGREVALVADEDEDAIHIVDAAKMERLATVELPATPTHLLVTEDGRVAVTLRYQNTVALLEPQLTPEKGLSPLCAEAVTREPIALAEHGEELLVISGYGAELTRMRHDSLQVTARIALAREPRGLLVPEGGDSAWVSHMVGGVLSKVDLTRGDASRIVTYRQGRGAQASRSVQGFALAAYVGPEGQTRLLMPQISSDAPDSERLERFRYYGTTPRTFLPWVASVDADEGEMLAVGQESSFLWRRICMLPRAALVRGDRLWVACLDKGSVIEMDARFVDPMTAVYRQYRVAAGPTGLAMRDDGTMFVWSRYGHQLTRVAVPALDDRPIAEVPEPQGVALTLPRRTTTNWTAARLRGRELFVARDDKRISKTGATCESCHPDGRDDGLMWAQGTSTLFLAGRLEGTAPYGWHGQQRDLAERVQSTLIRLQGEGLQRADKPELLGLLDYLRMRRPPPPPLPHSEAQQASIARGEQLFSKTLSCNACHADGGANGSKLRVDGELFDTPSLAFVASADHYFHDDRYDSIEAVLSDTKEPMDQTASLDAAQRADLASYLRSLPYGAVTASSETADSLRLRTVGPADAGWSKAPPKASLGHTLDHPGRYLEKRPQEVDLASVPSFTLPYQHADALGPVWLSLRDVGGTILGTSDGTLGQATIAHGTNLDNKLVPRFIASAHGAPALEIQSCRPFGGPMWQGQHAAEYGLKCPDVGARFTTSQLGGYGLAARTTLKGQPVLLAIGPDTFLSYSGGDVEDIGSVGRGWAELHALALKPGAHAELVRLHGADMWWDAAGFRAPLSSAIVNLSWPQGASKPQLLLATITSRKVFGKGR